MRPAARVPGLATFFFPQKLPFDAAGVHLNMKVLLHQVGQLSEAQRRLPHSLCHQELDHLSGELVTTSRTPLQGNQPRQPSFLERRLRLIERGPGKTKLVGRLRNRVVVDMDLPEHLVLHLVQVVGIEEVAVLKQGMEYILRTKVEGAVSPQGGLLVRIRLAPRHSQFPNQTTEL